MIFRKMGAAWKPDVQLLRDGDGYILKSTSSVKNAETPFKAGVQFDETTADNRKVKTTFTFDGDNKLVQEQVGDGGATIVREFTETGLTTVSNLPRAPNWHPRDKNIRSISPFSPQDARNLFLWLFLLNFADYDLQWSYGSASLRSRLIKCMLLRLSFIKKKETPICQ